MKRTRPTLWDLIPGWAYALTLGGLWIGAMIANWGW
jgi:hypothetical protein